MSQKICKALSLAFAAGCFGGLIQLIAIWICFQTKLNEHFHVALYPIPQMSLEWVYPKIFFGGLYGILFMLPFMQRSYLLRALIYGLIPSLVQLLVFLPFYAKKGFLGMQLGDLSPFFVLSFEMIWALSAGLWLQYTER